MHELMNFIQRMNGSMSGHNFTIAVAYVADRMALPDDPRDVERVGAALAVSLRQHEQSIGRAAQVADLCTQWINIGGSAEWCRGPVFDGLRSVIRARIDDQDRRPSFMVAGDADRLRPLESYSRLMALVVRQLEAELGADRMAALKRDVESMEGEACSAVRELSEALTEFESATRRK